MQFKVKEIEELEAVILAIKEKVSAPAIIILKGELGAGKTTFVRKFCESIGVKESVNSPTYVLQHEYSSDSYTIEHWDLYRVSEVPEELYEFSDKNTIRFIEWGDKFDELVDLSDLIISITTHEENDQIYRIFTFHSMN